MIRLAAKPADDTMKSNVEAFRAAKGDLREQLNKVGLDVEDKAMSVPARILPTPKLLYSNDMEFECRDGQWRPKKFRRIPNQGKGLINFEGKTTTKNNSKYYFSRLLWSNSRKYGPRYRKLCLSASEDWSTIGFSSC